MSKNKLETENAKGTYPSYFVKKKKNEKIRLQESNMHNNYHI